MKHKVLTVIAFLCVPLWIFITNILVPYGTSEIIGKLSAGDFEIQNYVGILILTIAPAAANWLVVIRVLDWVDWSLDAKCAEYLAGLAFDAVINQSMTFHSNKFSGSLTSAANKLPGAFITLKSGFLWDIYPLFLTIVFSIISAGVVCGPFAIMLTAYVVVYMAIAIVTYYKTQNVDAELADAENKQTGQLADAITNEVSVKSYARERFERGRFERATKRTREATMRVAKVSLWRNMSMNAINMVTYAGLLVLIILSHNFSCYI